jgi:hypothetical protein
MVQWRLLTYYSLHSVAFVQLGKSLPRLTTLSLHKTLASEGLPAVTSAAGWAALLLLLPYGLFRLDVSGCRLSYASYVLLLERVAEFEADKVRSPAEVAAAHSAAKRRGAAAGISKLDDVC